MKNSFLEAMKIWLLCIAAAIFYGILHDQVTARVCVEYFTVFHDDLFGTENPTLLGIGWGIVATWWMGAFLGLFLVFAARAGSRPRFTAQELVRPVGTLLAEMAFLALCAGLTGYALTRLGRIDYADLVELEAPRLYRARFMADLWAHNASYDAGFIGGVLLCGWVWRQRILRHIKNKINDKAG